MQEVEEAEEVEEPDVDKAKEELWAIIFPRFIPFQLCRHHRLRN